MMRAISNAIWAADRTYKYQCKSRKQMQDIMPDYTGRAILITVLLAIIICGALILHMETAGAATWEQWDYGRNPDITYTTMYVNVSESSHLNGRAEPSTKSAIEAKFERGEAVEVNEYVRGVTNPERKQRYLGYAASGCPGIGLRSQCAKAASAGRSIKVRFFGIRHWNTRKDTAQTISAVVR